MRTVVVLSLAYAADALRLPHTVNAASASSRRSAIFGAAAAIMIPGAARASPGVLNVAALQKEADTELVERLPPSSRVTALLGEVEDRSDFPTSLIFGMARFGWSPVRPVPARYPFPSCPLAPSLLRHALKRHLTI